MLGDSDWMRSSNSPGQCYQDCSYTTSMGSMQEATAENRQAQPAPNSQRSLDLCSTGNTFLVHRLWVIKGSSALLPASRAAQACRRLGASSPGRASPPGVDY
jgi:hypothetical protein